METKSTCNDLRAIAKRLFPSSDHIRNEEKIKFEFYVPRSLAPKLNQMIASERERYARAQCLYRHAERIELFDYAAARRR